MQRPLEIRFRKMDPSPEVEARIHEKAAELEHFSDRITGCRVTVEQEHRHHHKGNLFRVRVELDLPGKLLAVTRGGPKDHARTRTSTSRFGTLSKPPPAGSRTTSASERARSRRTASRCAAGCG
jgi:hypothetical protein